MRAIDRAGERPLALRVAWLAIGVGTLLPLGLLTWVAVVVTETFGSDYRPLYAGAAALLGLQVLVSLAGWWLDRPNPLKLIGGSAALVAAYLVLVAFLPPAARPWLMGPGIGIALVAIAEAIWRRPGPGRGNRDPDG